MLLGDSGYMKISILIFTSAISLLISACGSGKNDELKPVEVRYEKGKEYYDEGKYDKAIEELKFVTFNAPGSEIGDDAQYYLAESHFELKEYVLAISEYERLSRVHPESPFLEEGEYKRALCFDIQSPASHHDQTNTLKALDAYQEYIENWPQSENKLLAESRLDLLRFKLAKKQFDNGKQYEKLGECESAAIYMRQLLEKYYDSEFAAEARWRLAKCEIKLKNWNVALDLLSDILRRNEDAEFVEKAKKAIRKVKAKVDSESGQALADEH